MGNNISEEEEETNVRTKRIKNLGLGSQEKHPKNKHNVP